VAATLVYWAAAGLASVLIDPLVAIFGGESAYATALEQIRTHGVEALVLLELTPIPFQITMAAAGAAGLPFTVFLAIVTITRGVRHFAVAVLIWWIGLRAPHWIENHRREIFIASLLVFAALAALMLAGWI
jgi:membrane protein YqaA with SNARE-associated domain